MPIQRNDRDSQWTLNTADSKYTLAERATITVDEGYGIYEGTTNNEIVVLGDIVARGAASAGIRFMGSTSTLMIGDESRINARQIDYGIFAEGAGQEIVNRGRIEAETAGINGAIWGKVENFGTIEAFTGIYYHEAGSEIVNHGKISGTFGVLTQADGTSVINDKGGEISGEFAGVRLDGAGIAEITNKGIIRGDEYAIYGGSGVMNIVNTGKIIGDVSLSDGADHFDTRGGTVDGVIYGGYGDDTYYISQSIVKIDDQGGSFDDAVFSSASFRLAGGLEHLFLEGARDANATGNFADNLLSGNNSDNHVKGMAGSDKIVGGGGTDILSGGTGNDFFYFNFGDDVDKIADFEDGIDHIQSGYVLSQQDFDDLNIRSVRGDVVIDFGGGDRLNILDTQKSEITYADFEIT